MTANLPLWLAMALCLAAGAAHASESRRLVIRNQQEEPVGWTVSVPRVVGPQFLHYSNRFIQRHTLEKIAPEVEAPADCRYFLGLYVIEAGASERFHFSSIGDFTKNGFHNPSYVDGALSSKVVKLQHQGRPAYFFEKTRGKRGSFREQRQLFYVIEAKERFFVFEYDYYRVGDALDIEACRDSYFDLFNDYSQSLSPANP